MKTLTLALVALFGACGGASTPPPPPEPAAFAAMSEEQQCDATAPRAIPCTDALMVASFVSLGFDRKAAMQTVAETGHASADELRKVHQVACLDPDGAYVRGLVRCWAQPTCNALAACVYPEKPLEPQRPSPPPPPDAAPGAIDLVE